MEQYSTVQSTAIRELDHRVEFEGVKAIVQARDGDFEAWLFPGRSVYIDALNGSQYFKAKMKIVEIISEENRVIEFRQIMEFNVRNR